MGKKTLILSQKQIDEICGGNSAYLDGLAATPDKANRYSTEITSDGNLDGGYPNVTTTDDYAHTMTNDWRGNAKLSGMGPMVVREMTKSEWESRYIGEEAEHGNARLKNRTFGNSDEMKSYGATKMAVSRLNRAEKTARTGSTPTERAKAAKTVSNMKKNWGGLDNARSQYNGAKAVDNVIQNSKPEGTKIASATKVTGNGKGHSESKGFITPHINKD